MLTRVGHSVVTRRMGLEPATTSYRINPGVPVPMRDGVNLLADHYAPVTDAPVGTLLLRGPYVRDSLFTRLLVGVYATRGYHVVMQSTRGCFGSGGVFEPSAGEVNDGADTVSWLRGQPWFTGTFATAGGSYLGFTQWAVLADSPPELTTAVVTMGPHDFSIGGWGTGSFALADFLTWAYQMAWHERGEKICAGSSGQRSHRTNCGPSSPNCQSPGPRTPPWVDARGSTTTGWKTPTRPATIGASGPSPCWRAGRCC